MKISVLFIALFFIGSASLAADSKVAPKKSIKAPPAGAPIKLPPKPDIPAPITHDNLYKEIEVFSTKKLDAKKDFAEVKKTINSLLILDTEDPSRTSVMILSESYNKNKAVYDKAIKAVETKKNKKQLKEIQQLLSSFSKEGNG